jgi:predicted DNA binding CopG/RHH family protein
MPREKMLRIRVSDYEYEQLRQEAEKQGIGMSDFLRKYISKLPKPENFTAVKTAKFAG